MIDNAVHMAQLDAPLKREFISKKVIVDDRGDGLWLASFERGHMAHCEMPTMYQCNSEEYVIGMAEYANACDEQDLAEHLAIPFFIIGDKQHEWFEPHCTNYHLWLCQIKEAFEPQNIADPGFYISSKKENL